MSRQVMIEPGTTAEDSTPITVTADARATVGMFAPDGGGIHGQSVCHVMIETPGEPSILRTFKGEIGAPFVMTVLGPCVVFGRRPAQAHDTPVGMFYDDGIGSP